MKNDFGDFIVQELCYEHAYSLGHLGILNSDSASRLGARRIGCCLKHGDKYATRITTEVDDNGDEINWFSVCSKCNDLHKPIKPFTTSVGGKIPSGPNKQYHDFMDGIVDRFTPKPALSGVIEEEVCHCGDTLANHNINSGHTFTPMPLDIDHEARKIRVWSDAAHGIDGLTETVKRTGEAVITATQSVEELQETLEELSPYDLAEATRLEDHIENELEKYVGPGWMPIEVTDSDPETGELCKVGTYVRERFSGWDVRWVPGNPTWEFKAR
jgi:hypothetical protein